MSTITRSYTFADGTTAYGSQVESEIANIVTTWNNHDSGVSSWTQVKSSGDITVTGSNKGLVVTSPNGLHTLRFGIDNNAVPTYEVLT